MLVETRFGSILFVSGGGGGGGEVRTGIDCGRVGDARMKSSSNVRSIEEDRGGDAEVKSIRSRSSWMDEADLSGLDWGIGGAGRVTTIFSFFSLR